VKPKFIRCEICKAEIPADICEFAVYRAVIDGEEYVFCCAQLYKRYREKKKNEKKP